MKQRFKLIPLISLSALHSFAQPVGSIQFDRTFVYNEFKKGNTHTHSNRTDGDSDPLKVMNWYRDQGYHFLALTDHNIASKPGEFSDAETSSFISIPGEEISWAYTTPIRNPSVHVNSLCATRTVGGKRTETAVQALTQIIRSVEGQRGAIAQINHPNYEWALNESMLAEGYSGASLLEVYNQHPHVKNEGDKNHPSVEKMWDGLLSRGIRIWAMATDDMHDLVGNPGFEPRRPGRGWVEVASPQLTPEAICQSLDQGRFYSSTGVALARIQVFDSEIYIEIIQRTGELASYYKTEFIGQNGELLSTQRGQSAHYILKGFEKYVRARITSPAGNEYAWTQPVFTRPVP